MALSVPFVGSGQFVAETEWSCPNHEFPEVHECDCQFCDWEPPECCDEAEWVDKRDADGNVVTRELSVWEASLRNLWIQDAAARESRAQAWMEVLEREPWGKPAVVSWVEDDLGR